MRIYTLCLLGRPFTYFAFLGGIGTFLLGYFVVPLLLRSVVPDIPEEVVEGSYLLYVFSSLGIMMLPFGMAWETRKIYWKIYPYILKDGPGRYWAVTRFHGGCSYLAFRIAELDTRKLRMCN